MSIQILLSKTSIYICLLLITTCSSLNFIILQQKEIAFTTSTSIIKITNIDTTSYFPNPNCKSMGMSAWFSISNTSSATLMEIIYTDNTKESLIVNGGFISLRGGSLQYDDNTWGFVNAQFNYLTGSFHLFYTGKNGLLTNYYSQSITSKIGGGADNTPCSCSMSRVYVYPNNYPTINPIPNGIYSLAGGDVKPYAWYTFASKTDAGTTIPDMSGNGRTINITNPIGTSIFIDTTNQIATLTRAYLSMPNAPEWFTPSDPSLTISFQFKFSTSMTKTLVPILSRQSGTASVFLLEFQISSYQIYNISITVSDGVTPNTFTPQTIVDNLWHYCMVQVISVKGTKKAYQYAKMDGTISSWTLNNHNGYQDLPTDTFYIGRYANITNTANNFVGSLKDFRIYTGVFNYDTNIMAFCDFEFGSYGIYQPNFANGVTSTRTCLKCTTGYSLNIDATTKIGYCCDPLASTCEPTCSANSYKVSQTCLTCDSTCGSCNGGTISNCLTCASSLFFNYGQCLVNCPVGKYGDTSDYKCKPCDQTCYTCSGPNQNQCLSCSSSNSLPYLISANNTCNAACPIGYYPDQSNICLLCDSTCYTCSGPNQNECLSCNNLNGLPYLISTNNSCSSSCPVGFYSNSSNVCLACDSTCYTCSGPGQNQCLSCSNLNGLPYLVPSSSTCNSACPTSFYPNSSNVCLSCDPTCYTCSGPNSNQCLSCSNTNGFPYLIPSSQSCSSACPTGFYPNSSNVCLSCDPTCYTCSGPNQNQCLSCSNANGLPYLIPSSNTCNSACPTSYYSNSSNVCLTCDSTCYTCSGPNSNQCLSCSNTNGFPYLIPSSSTCNSACPTGFYPNSSNVCLACDSTCYTCSGSNSNQCLSCSNANGLPYLISSNHTCSSTCPIGFYPNSSNVCSSCDPSCYTCSGPNQNQCLSCSNANGLPYLITASHTCSSTCPTGFYPNSSNVCLSCDPTCYTCNGPNQNQCLSCSNLNGLPYLISSNHTCASTCPTGFYSSSSNICLACDPTCYTCSGPNSNQCLSCSNLNGFPILNSASHTCSSACSAGFYLDSSNVCLPCDPTCYTCSGPSQSQCLSCNSLTGYSYYISSNHTCNTACPIGFYSSPSNVCLACDSTCYTCNGPNSNQCLSCSSSSTYSYLIPSSHTCNSACPIGFYSNSSNICLSCNSACYTCSGPNQNQCQSCKSSSSLPYFISSNNSCSSSCPTGYYADSQNICQSCHSTCYTCTGPNQNQCSSCSNSNGLPYLITTNNTCNANCQLGYYPNLQNICMACHSTCYTCYGPNQNQCLSCNSATTLPYFFSNNNTCNTNCPIGYYPNSLNNCLSCHPTCYTCSGPNSNQCQTCSSLNGLPYYISANSSCNANCQVNYYPNSQNICMVCHSTCYQCSGPNQNQCTSCSNGNGLPYLISTNNTCSATCQPGYYINTNNVCLPCDTTCATCAISATNCLTCDNTRYLYSNTCVMNCPVRYYQDPITRSCLPCYTGCLTCTSSSQNSCTTCDTNFPYMFNGQCLQNCPIDYNPDPATKICNQCPTNLGFFYSFQTNNCFHCSSNCTKCTGVDHNCIECINSTFPTYYLDTNTSNVQYKYCRPLIKFTKSSLSLSQFNTLDAYLTFNFTLKKSNIPDLYSLFSVDISDFRSKDFKYSITQISNTNITFGLKPKKPINKNNLTITILDTTQILDSNNLPVLNIQNPLTLGTYIIDIFDPDKYAMLVAGILAIASLPAAVTIGLNAIWGFVDFLQLLFYFIFLNMNIPENWRKFLLCFKVSTLPLPKITSYLLEYLKDTYNLDLPDEELQEKFADNGIDSLFIRNGLSIIFYIILSYIFIYSVILIERGFKKLTQQNDLKAFVKFIQWNFALRFILQVIVQLSFASYLQFNNFSFHDAISIVSDHFAICGFVFVIGFMAWTFYKIQSKFFTRKFKLFTQRYGVLTEEFVDPRLTDIPLIVKNQIVIQIFRKMIYTIGFVFLYDYVIANLCILLLQNFIMIYMIFAYKPYKRTAYNMKIIVQEFIYVLLEMLLIMIYCDSISGDNNVEACGYIMIILSCIGVMYNLVFTSIDIYIGWKLLLQSLKGCLKKYVNQKNKKRICDISAISQAESKILPNTNEINPAPTVEIQENRVPTPYLSGHRKLPQISQDNNTISSPSMSISDDSKGFSNVNTIIYEKAKIEENILKKRIHSQEGMLEQFNSRIYEINHARKGISLDFPNPSPCESFEGDIKIFDITAENLHYSASNTVMGSYEYVRYSHGSPDNLYVSRFE